jgi:transposase-like protein
MIQRGGEVVIRMLENVQQRTIKPLIKATIAPGTCIYTDEYDIYSRLEPWGYAHASVCQYAFTGPCPSYETPFCP